LYLNLKRRDMFAPKTPWPGSVPNFTRIVAVIFALLLVSRVLLHAQDTTPTNPTLVSAYLAANGNADTMVTGGTLQFTAYGTYSDGSVVALPDTGGDGVIAWNTSNHAVAKISTLGHATAMGTGTVNIEAMIGTITASPLTVTVKAASVPTTVLPSIPLEVSAFVQSFGVNTDLSYAGTPYYGQPQSVISALKYLGINTIRDQPPGYSNDPATTATDNAIAAAGVKFDVLILGNGPVNIPGNLASITAFEEAYPGVIAGIEGPNEINNWPITYGSTTNTYAAGVQVSKALWSAVQDSSLLKEIPVYALTLGAASSVPADEKELGDLAPYVTYGNAHIYACCSNNVWDEDMPWWLPIDATDTPGRPMIVTETGYQLALEPGGTVDALSAAKYYLNTFFQNALNGIARTFIFELADESTTFTYGLFDGEWTPRAGATAISNLTTILALAGGGIASAPLDYSVSGLPSTGRTFLLGSNTAYDIAVWIDATVFDPTTETDVTAPTYVATVNLGATFASVEVYDPMIGTAPIATYSDVSSVPVNVTDHPLIVQVVAK
jgi:hypothetical protein